MLTLPVRASPITESLANRDRPRGQVRIRYGPNGAKSSSQLWPSPSRAQVSNVPQALEALGAQTGAHRPGPRLDCRARPRWPFRLYGQPPAASPASGQAKASRSCRRPPGLRKQHGPHRCLKRHLNRSAGRKCGLPARFAWSVVLDRRDSTRACAAQVPAKRRELATLDRCCRRSGVGVAIRRAGSVRRR